MQKYLSFLWLVLILTACNSTNNSQQTTQEEKDPNRFADLRILTYDASGIDKLSTQQKELVYYLSQAALSGREIIYAQNYKHNIQIKRTLEEIYQKYSGEKSGEQWEAFEVYLKRIWFANGIHHHYAEKKFDQDLMKPILMNWLKIHLMQTGP